MAVRAEECTITAREAVRAIYLDFESFVDQEPVLAGVLCEYDFAQYALDTVLAPAAAEKGVKLSTLGDLIDDLIGRCKKDRVLVAFTQHEKDEVLRWANRTLEPHYCDAHKIAIRWRSECLPDAHHDNQLRDFLQLLGIERPKHIGYKTATSQLRSVIAGLEARGSYRELTSVQKGKWTKLLQRNRLDCTGMRDLTIAAAIEVS